MKSLYILLALLPLAAYPAAITGNIDLKPISHKANQLKNFINQLTNKNQ